MDALAETLLLRLGHTSLQACVLGAVVYALTRYIPSLSAATRALLWWLVGVQAVAGLFSGTAWQLPWLPSPQPTAIEPTTITVMAPTTWHASHVPSLPEAHGIAWTTWLFAAWAAIVAIQAIVAFVQWRRIRGVIARALPHDDARLETMVSQRARRLGMRRSPALACSVEVVSPQVVGILRPTILLPVEAILDDSELEMALVHELAHVRRGDIWLGWIPALARALFFFHPLVHYATREYALSREAACDAEVLRRGRQAPQAYGRLLLRMGVSPHTRHALGGASPTFETLKRRLTMLQNANEKSPRALAWFLVAVVSVAGVVPYRVVASTHVAPAVDMQARPAPVAPSLPPLPTAPPEPMPPGVPPAPPVPPQPTAPFGSEFDHSVVTFDSDARSAYVIMDGRSMFMSGTRVDAQRARQQRKGDEPLLWFRRADGEWVVRDQTYIKKIQSAFSSVSDLSEKQQALAGKQQALAQKQQGLGQQQASLGYQQAKLGTRQAEMSLRAPDPSLSSARDVLVGEQNKLAVEQSKIGEQAAKLGMQQGELGSQQAELGQRQREAGQRAQRDVENLLDEAVRTHVAQAAR
ncbi:beta-lactamase regulating signal transducer with metallopeptidase domain [Luteibacter rhizovicinus]|uniref:Beta-lactamase regulating signal transducer with metallopeptidase domain n=1 Tax=Luteibacter rhizovicinus TaxID=242606 RepID=A0A4R3YTA9_9GAMM|nr:M56 family metallopeptidase [Luteibacter rhizovicinus]TCV95662.1 beta-lactamase regulating signal transducer with metallopeptidase domain [Luteibacter rhizovicinus]